MTNLSSRQRSACFASRRYHGRYAHASRRVTKTDDRPLLAAGAPDRAQFSNAGFRLALYLRFAAVVTTLISLGIKLVIAVMFGLLAARSSSSRTEREALQVRQQSPDAARGGLSLAALVPVENAFLRHWRNNCRSLVRRQRMRFRCKPATLPLPIWTFQASTPCNKSTPQRQRLFRCSKRPGIIPGANTGYLPSVPTPSWTTYESDNQQYDQYYDNYSYWTITGARGAISTVPS